MELPLAAGLASVLLLASAFLSASEIGYLAISKARAAQLRETGGRSARVLHGLAQNPTLVLSAILAGITACAYSIETIATLVAERHAEDGIDPALAHSIAVFGTAIVWLLLAEVTPVLYAIQNPERVALAAAVPLWLWSRLLWVIVVPFTLAAHAASWLMRGGKPRGDPTMTEDEVKKMIELGEEHGSLEADEKRMLHGVFQFADATVKDVMVPRVDMVCVEAEDTVEDALRTMVTEKHSRLPVYEDTIDHVIGILYAKDLIPCVRRGELDVPSKSLVRPPVLVPETTPVRTLLRDLQRQHRLMAVAVDEYGGVAGLVTIEDIIEEIVGEILDESDVDESRVREIGHLEYLCDGAASLHELNQFLDVPIPEDEYDSVGGLIYGLLGRVPEQGEACRYGHLRLTVEKVENRRIEKVRAVESANASPGRANDS
ncbi:MAG: hemolysin family protein [Armatimonadota bacterium]